MSSAVHPFDLANVRHVALLWGRLIPSLVGERWETLVEHEAKNALDFDKDHFDLCTFVKRLPASTTPLQRLTLTPITMLDEPSRTLLEATYPIHPINDYFKHKAFYDEEYHQRQARVRELKRLKKEEKAQKENGQRNRKGAKNKDKRPTTQTHLTAYLNKNPIPAAPPRRKAQGLQLPKQIPTPFKTDVANWHLAPERPSVKFLDTKLYIVARQKKGTSWTFFDLPYFDKSLQPGQKRSWMQLDSPTRISRTIDNVKRNTKQWTVGWADFCGHAQAFGMGVKGRRVQSVDVRFVALCRWDPALTPNQRKQVEAHWKRRGLYEEGMRKLPKEQIPKEHNWRKGITQPSDKKGKRKSPDDSEAEPPKKRHRITATKPSDKKRKRKGPDDSEAGPPKKRLRKVEILIRSVRKMESSPEFRKRNPRRKLYSVIGRNAKKGRRAGSAAVGHEPSRAVVHDLWRFNTRIRNIHMGSPMWQKIIKYIRVPVVTDSVHAARGGATSFLVSDTPQRPSLHSSSVFSFLISLHKYIRSSAGMPSARSPEGSCLITSTFPPEVVSEILAIALGSMSPAEITMRRLELYHLSSAFYRCIRDTPTLWNRVHITHSTKPEALLYHLSRSSRCTLRVFFVYNFHNPACPGPRNTIHTLVTSTLLPVLSVVRQLHSFQLMSDSRIAMDIVNTAFSSRPAPNLTRLVIGRGRQRYEPRGTTEGPSAFWFQPHLPSLQELMMTGVNLPTTFPSSTSLNRVVFAHCVFSGVQVVQGFQAFMGACTSLKALVLSAISLRDVAAFGFQCISSPSLELLCVDSHGLRSMGWLLARMHLPNLLDLAVHVSSTEDLADLLAVPSLSYASVKYLRIVAESLTVVDFISFFPLFPSVQALNLRRAHCAFISLVLESTVSVQSDITTILPSLKALYIPFHPFSVVKDFAILHGASASHDPLALTLHKIQMLPPDFHWGAPGYQYSPEELELLEWLTSHLSDFTLGASIPPLRSGISYEVTGCGRWVKILRHEV
ncbi:hypothetical protein DFH06DRAFT_1123092 [Mycena polygramma]|nr:hypothetical protein DFH06DRAFT_1123092 [Mycena polygramma]